MAWGSAWDGRCKYDQVTHNRLLMALAHAFGHHVETFGKPELCEGGILPDLGEAELAELLELAGGWRLEAE